MRWDQWLVYGGGMAIRGTIIGVLAAYIFFSLAGCAAVDRTPQEQCHRDHRNACEASLFESNRENLQVGVYDSGQILAFCNRYADTTCPVLP